MMSERIDPPDNETDLALGDKAATEGRWPDAIAVWEHAATANPSLASAVEARLAWLATHRLPQATRRQVPGLVYIVCSLASAAIGMAFLAIPEDPGLRFSNIMSLGAWVMIAASIASGLIASRQLGAGTAPADISLETSLREAKAVAHRLETQNSTEKRPT